MTSGQTFYYIWLIAIGKKCLFFFFCLKLLIAVDSHLLIKNRFLFQRYWMMYCIKVLLDSLYNLFLKSSLRVVLLVNNLLHYLSILFFIQCQRFLNYTLFSYSYYFSKVLIRWIFHNVNITDLFNEIPNKSPFMVKHLPLV